MIAGKRIHFIGIGGIGMSGLARLALSRGAEVSGCDREDSVTLAALVREGITIAVGHDQSHTQGMDTVVYTSAVAESHPEVVAAGDRATRRGSFLAEMLKETRSIGVCGTHGKTTTTWMLAHILTSAGLTPTILLGGIVSAINGNFKAGGDIFVAELDESDGSFLQPELEMAVITNVESEHLHFYGDFSQLQAAFKSFAEAVKGTLIVPAELADQLSSSCETLSFGRSADADLQARDVVSSRSGETFALWFKGERIGDIELPVNGEHNIQNALAASACALGFGVPAPRIAEAFQSFSGVDRRMQLVATARGVPVYSDYAHHPTEVEAAIQGIRARHPGKLLVCFQPHLYSRTRDYADRFASALSKADLVIVADIYPAREEPIPGVDSTLIVEPVRNAGVPVFGPMALDRVTETLLANIEGVDAAVLMGAGDIGKVVDEIMAAS